MIIKNIYLFDGTPLRERSSLKIGENGTILSIAREITPAPDEEIIDGNGMIALPGITDAHRHVWQGPFCGFAADMLLLEYLEKINTQIGQKISAEDLYYINLYGYLSAVDNGICTVFDWSHIMNSPEHADAALKAAADSGMNVLFFHSTSSFERERYWNNSSTTHHPDAVRIIENSSGYRNVKAGLGIRGPEFASMEVNKADIELARSLGCPVSMHIGSAFLGTLVKPVLQLQEADLLNTDLNLVHCSTLSSDEYRLIADAGCLVTITPEAEMQTALGHPAAKFICDYKHAKWSVGTDIPSGSTDSMIYQQRLLLQLARAADNQVSIDKFSFPEKISFNANDFFFESSRHANKYAGFNVSEKIETGKLANFSLLKWQSLEGSAFASYPAFYYMQEANIDLTVLNGTIVKKDGLWLKHDMEGLCSQIKEIVRRIL